MGFNVCPICGKLWYAGVGSVNSTSPTTAIWLSVCPNCMETVKRIVKKMRRGG